MAPHIEQYIQETGRAGRNGSPAIALLLFNKSGKHLGEAMIGYCSNQTVSRQLIINPGVKILSYY